MKNTSTDFSGQLFAKHSIRSDCGLTANAADIVKEYGFDSNALVVGDCNTYPLLQAGLPDHTCFVYPEPPVADRLALAQLTQAAKGATAIIAVGSGTINDLCKVASHQLGIPYLVYPTAASMNGYISPNASLLIRGLKQSVPATAPQAVLIERDIICDAPRRLAAAGLGDTLCRSTVQADALLSHHLTGSSYNTDYFERLAPNETILLDQGAALQAGDEEITLLLMESLMLSGLAMGEAKSSAPASQGEHMIAHLMGLLSPYSSDVFHGEEIAVTTVTMAAIQQNFLKQPSPLLRMADKALIERALPDPASKMAILAYQSKFPNMEAITNAKDKLHQHWPDIRNEIQAIIVPLQRLHTALHAAGAPTSPQQIGWEELTYLKAVRCAFMTRDRVTFLDLEN